jgi:predicted  nucleic acid-binding Zn-ribbon protein
MPKPLDERIAAAMSADARIATVAELISEVGGVITSTQAEHDRLDALSKSATATEAEADAAADAAAKLSRKIIRLSAKQEQLTERQEELTKSERQKKLRAEYDAIKDRRDALATELADRWPALTAEIVALLTRLEESDRECYRINQSFWAERLYSAESLARECSPNFYALNTPLHRFYDIRLPSLRGQGSQEMAWPIHSAPGSTIMVPTP